MLMGEVDQFAELGLGIEGEGTTAELEAVDVVAHSEDRQPGRVKERGYR